MTHFTVSDQRSHTICFGQKVEHSCRGREHQCWRATVAMSTYIRPPRGLRMVWKVVIFMTLQRHTYYHYYYYEPIGNIISCFKDCFDQPGYEVYCKFEQLLVKASKKISNLHSTLCAPFTKMTSNWIFYMPKFSPLLWTSKICWLQAC